MVHLFIVFYHAASGIFFYLLRVHNTGVLLLLGNN